MREDRRPSPLCKRALVTDQMPSHRIMTPVRLDSARTCRMTGCARKREQREERETTVSPLLSTRPDTKRCSSAGSDEFTDAERLRVASDAADWLLSSIPACTAMVSVMTKMSKPRRMKTALRVGVDSVHALQCSTDPLDCDDAAVESDEVAE